MYQSVVLSVHAHDRPGIMSRISNLVTSHGGNWLESKMARLGGQFAGIVRVGFSEDQDEEEIEILQEKFASLEHEGIFVIMLDEGDLTDYPYTHCLKIEVFGNDRPGIISQLTQAVSQAGGNIEELNSTIESAAMSGHAIFRAHGTVCLPDSVNDSDLTDAIENLGDDLTVEITCV